jgi:hypothetical protein
MRDFSVNDEGTEVSLIHGRAVSIVFISDAAKYEEYISKVITSLVPFKNINILYLDYTLYKRKINKFRRAFLEDRDIPIIHVYINNVLYHKIFSENINHEYISTLLKNLHQTFVFKQDFSSNNACNMNYVFHGGAEQSSDPPTPPSATRFYNNMSHVI